MSRLSGPFEIIGIANGDPTNHTTLKPEDPTRSRIAVFNGLAQVIVRSKRGETGQGLIEVAGKDVGQAKIEVVVGD